METNNKIIAEFIGYKEYVNEGAIQLYIKDKVVKSIGQLDFHSDWNWLMQVVEKIESLGYRVTIVRHICRIDLTEEIKLIISEDIKKIEAVYTACLEFIKWYNKQNQ